jgi:uncharacterized membrane protein
MMMVMTITIIIIIIIINRLKGRSINNKETERGLYIATNIIHNRYYYK